MYESFLYHPEKGFKYDASRVEIEAALKDERGMVWLDIPDIDDEDIDFLTTTFNIHPLTVEDFIMPNARPKVENFGSYIYLIMFALEMKNGNSHGKLNPIELDCCLGRNFLITFHNSPILSLTACKERVKKQSPTITSGADMLLYSILDSCFDSYFPIIAEFDNMVDEMSDELFGNPDQKTLKRIYTLKNDITFLRRTIGPQADVAGVIARGDFALIAPSNTIYFRNIYDNLVRLNDVVGTSRDIITGAMEAYMSVVSNRMNEIMKTLTIIATIMMPLTLVASIYGMNFKFMPGLEHKHGYSAIIGLMIIVTAVMLTYFKRRKWI